MKIAATDFDGTLCPIGEPIPEENIRAIKAWQAAGNKFGIATGRGLSLIREAVNQYDDLKLDFLVCNNGAVSLDEQGNMMHCQAIAPDVLRGLLSMDVVQDERYSLLVFTAFSICEPPADTTCTAASIFAIRSLMAVTRCIILRNSSPTARIALAPS